MKSLVPEVQSKYLQYMFKSTVSSFQVEGVYKVAYFTTPGFYPCLNPKIKDVEPDVFPKTFSHVPQVDAMCGCQSVRKKCRVWKRKLTSLPQKQDKSGHRCPLSSLPPESCRNLCHLQPPGGQCSVLKVRVGARGIEGTRSEGMEMNEIDVQWECHPL